VKLSILHFSAKMYPKVKSYVEYMTRVASNDENYKVRTLSALITSLRSIRLKRDEDFVMGATRSYEINGKI
jgi:hypothetical protein